MELTVCSVIASVLNFFHQFQDVTWVIFKEHAYQSWHPGFHLLLKSWRRAVKSATRDVQHGEEEGEDAEHRFAGS